MQFDFRTELGKITPKIAEGSKIYVFGAGANWANICQLHKYLVNINIDDYIDGFIDNDNKKQGTLFHGKPVYALTDVDIEKAVVLVSVASMRTTNKIIHQLAKAGMCFEHSVFAAGYFTSIIMQWEYIRLMQFKDKHKDKRCFIIGNGPSLTVFDLDKIINEISFATNSAYLLFSKTKWRPSYYVIADAERIEHSHKHIKKVDCTRFYASNFVFEIDNFALAGDYFYNIDFRPLWQPAKYRKPVISEEPLMMGWGATVTYDCLQLAMYMGFKEIYLLGMDHNYAEMVNERGELIKNDCANHFSKQYKKGIYTAKIDIVNAAYRSAREYAEQHGIKIYNATRGGKLEVFERVDFDSLF